MQTFNKPAHAALGGLWHRIPEHVKLAFFTGMIGGLLAYLYALTNLLIGTGDSLIHEFSRSIQVWSGRWSSEWLCAVSPPLSMPMINGVIGLLAVSLLAALAVDFLNIRSRPLVILASLLIVLYPSVGDLLKYTYLFDGFMLAALCAVAGMWLSERFRFGWLAGIPLMILSLGTYQAFISLVIALIFVRAVWLLMVAETADKDVVRFLLRSAWFVLASVIGYYAVTRLYNHIFGIALLNYQSISRMGSMSVPRMLTNLLRCYSDFFGQTAVLSNRGDFLFPGFPNSVLMGANVVLIAAGFLYGRKKTVFKTVLLAVILLLSPALLCGIRLFGPEVVDVRMVYSLVCLYLLAAMLLEQLPSTLKRLEASAWHGFGRFKGKAMIRLLLISISWLMLICLLLCLFAWTVGINLDFFQSRLDYENTYAQCSAYLSLAEATQGYHRHMPVYIVGSPAASAAAARENPVFQEPKYYYYFMFYFLGADLPVGVANQVNDEAWRLARTDRFRSMPSYPAPGSCAVIEDAMMVKLSQTGD